MALQKPKPVEGQPGKRLRNQTDRIGRKYFSSLHYCSHATLTWLQPNALSRGLHSSSQQRMRGVQHLIPTIITISLALPGTHSAVNLCVQATGAGQHHMSYLILPAAQGCTWSEPSLTSLLDHLGCRGESICNPNLDGLFCAGRSVCPPSTAETAQQKIHRQLQYEFRSFIYF